MISDLEEDPTPVTAEMDTLAKTPSSETNSHRIVPWTLLPALMTSRIHLGHHREDTGWTPTDNARTRRKQDQREREEEEKRRKRKAPPQTPSKSPVTVPSPPILCHLVTRRLFHF
jgi:hypothetical protein